MYICVVLPQKLRKNMREHDSISKDSVSFMVLNYAERKCFRVHFSSRT